MRINTYLYRHFLTLTFAEFILFKIFPEFLYKSIFVLPSPTLNFKTKPTL